jgi:ankyrin repeat protein
MEATGFTELLDAIRRGDRREVRGLVRRDARLVTMRDPAGFTPLLSAILARPWHTRVIATLLEAGADPNLAFPDGNTALHCAVDVGPDRGRSSRLVIKMLIDAGASLTARQSHGWTPLLCAILRGRVADTRCLLDAGADPNDVLPHDAVPAFAAGRTALMAALTSPNAGALLRVLLRAGADAERADLYGMTLSQYSALMAARPRSTLRLYRPSWLRIVPAGAL